MQNNRNKGLYAAGIFLMMFTASICTTTQGVMLTNYISYYHLESFQQGLMSAFQSGGNLVALFLLGALLGRLTKRKILIITALAVPAVFLVFGMKPSFYVLLAGYGVYGMVFAFLDSLSSSIMVDLFQEKSAFSMNLLHGVYGLGGLLGPVILKILKANDFAWNEMLLATGVIALAASAIYIASAAFAGEPGSIQPEGDRQIKLTDIIRFLKERKKQTLFVCAFLYGAHQIGITVWMTRYVSDYLGEPELGALTLSVFWVCVAVSRLVFPVFGWKQGDIIWAGNLISGLAILVGVVIGDGGIMVGCVGISGLAEGMILPSALDMACHWTMENTTLGSNMVLLAHYAGFIVTPMVIGAVISVASVSAGMILPALLSLAAAALMYWLCRVNRDAKNA